MRKLKVLRFTLILLCSLFFLFPVETKAATINSGTYNIIVYNQNNTRVHNLEYDSWTTNKQFAYSPSGTNRVASVGFLVQLPEPLLGNTYYDFEFKCVLKAVTGYDNIDVDGYDVSGWEQYIGHAKFGVDQSDYTVVGRLERALVTSNYVDSIMIRLYLDSDTAYYGTFYTCLNSFSYNINGTAVDFDNTNSIITSGITNIEEQVSGVSSAVTGVSNQVVTLNNSIVEYNNTVSSGLDAVNDSIGEGVASITAGLGNGFNLVSGNITAGVGSIISQMNQNDSNLLSFLDTLFYTNLNGQKYSRIESIDDSLNLIWASLTASIEPAVNNINNNVSLLNSSVINGFSNLQTNMINGMNTINSDIQNQMIAQTTNLLNSVAVQTNTLDTSIKHMENAVVNKLDETLKLQDDTPVKENNNLNTDLGDVVGEYDEIEKDLVTDFNESLDSIDTENASSIYNQNDFIKSAQFVSTNMQNIYDSNDFVGSMIDFTLLLGLIFTVIGISVARG